LWINPLETFSEAQRQVFFVVILGELQDEEISIMKVCFLFVGLGFRLSLSVFSQG
jgi:hypothetical protein